MFFLAELDIKFELDRNGKLAFISPDSKDLETLAGLLFDHVHQYTTRDY
jgi:hypothetical protein